MLKIMLLGFHQHVVIAYDKIYKRNNFRILVRGTETEVKKFDVELRMNVCGNIPYIQPYSASEGWEMAVNVEEMCLVRTLNNYHDWDILRGYHLYSTFTKEDFTTHNTIHKEMVLNEAQIEKVPSKLLWRFDPKKEVEEELAANGAFDKSKGDFWFKVA